MHSHQSLPLLAVEVPKPNLIKNKQKKNYKGGSSLWDGYMVTKRYRLNVYAPQIHILKPHPSVAVVG